MGRAAGAALTLVAPEAKVASKAAHVGRRRRPAVPDPRVSRPGTAAARQRQQIEDIKAARTPEPEPTPTPAPAPASSGGGLSLPATPATVGTGSGFLLGVFAWALGLAYLQGGSAGVKKFLTAKFLNKT